MPPSTDQEPPFGVDCVLGLVRDAQAEEALAVQPPAPLTGVLSGVLWQDFQLGTLVGRGAMGEVYSARQLSVDRTVAIKVMLATASSDAGFLRRWDTEARAAAAVISPHVVVLHSSGTIDGRPCIVMEYVSGGTVGELIAARRELGRPLAPIETVELLLQAARGLLAVHLNGLVHRDIKPSNLMLDGKGRVKVTDFGLVRVLNMETMTATGLTLGTPLYMAPEQGRGQPIDGRCDLYALGVVLYELLTLRPPFTADTPDALMFQHGFAEPELPTALNPDVPTDLQAVCLKCLQKDPERRYADAQLLIEDLERLRAGLAPLVAVFPHGRPDTGAKEALRQLSGRHRWLPVLVGAAAFALVLVLAWDWFDGRRNEAGLLRQRLAPLAVATEVPATAEADLARLASLVGKEDAQVAQGRTKLDELTALNAGLAQIPADPDHRDLAAIRTAVARLGILTGERDPALPRWQAVLARGAAEEQDLRRSLATLDGATVPDPAQRAAAQLRLPRLERLTGPADSDLVRWQRLVRESTEAVERLRRSLARLDSGATPTAQVVDAMTADTERLVQLAPEDPDLAHWRRRLGEETARLAGLRAEVARLLARAGDSNLAERAALARSAETLRLSGAAAEGQLAEVAAVLERAERQRATLAARLAVLDSPHSLPPDLAADLAGYEAQAGLDDPDARRWRTRFEQIRALLARLGPVDRPGPPPATADLEALAALVGTDDTVVTALRAKAAAIASTRAWLAATLDRTAAPPAEATERLGQLGTLVGPVDPDVQRWTGRLATWSAAGRLLDGLDTRWVLGGSDRDEALRRLADATAIAGEDDPLLRRWRERLRAIDGPDRPAWSTGHGRDGYGSWAELTLRSASQRQRWLPPGTFTMGSPADEVGRSDDETACPVRLTRGRWIADSECAQALWQAVMNDNPALTRDDRLPVEQVSHPQAVDFCQRLAGRLGNGAVVRLPSEAEWEAAARAGRPGAWAGLDVEEAAAAIVHGTRGSGPEAARGRMPNALGLFDMLGNVWEWCGTGYGPPPAGGVAVDPTPAPTARMAVRGGSWCDPLDRCRAANRLGLPPATASPHLGFRFVIEPAP
ncbi:MAG: protein kinase [Caulobacterales bacterium]|nr:protein kinase [Caulobacterales bacterium]